MALTGHVGARINRQVALVTDDFLLYHRLVPFFESYGIPVLGLAPGETVPPSVQVLLGGPPDDPRTVSLREGLEATLLAARQALDERRHVRETGAYHRVVFGVDPGQVIGLAVLGDEEPMLVAECLSPRSLVERIVAWADGLQADVWEVHVGNGHPEVGKPVLRLLREAVPHMVRSLVPEQATNPFSAATGSRHADAAIQIAHRRPREG